MSCGRGCYEIGGPWIDCDPDCPEHGYDARKRSERMDALEAENEALRAKVAAYDALVMSYEDLIEKSSKWLNDSTQWYSDGTLEPQWASKWTKKDYTTQAEEFVSCYGKGYCRDEFVSEYCQLFEGRFPFDPDKLQAAILEAEKA